MFLDTQNCNCLNHSVGGGCKRAGQTLHSAWLNAWLMENNGVMDEVIAATAPPNNESVRNNKDALNCDGRTCGRHHHHRLIRIINSPENVGLWATSGSNSSTGAEWLYPLVLSSYSFLLSSSAGRWCSSLWSIRRRLEPSRKLESRNLVFCFIFDSRPNYQVLSSWSEYPLVSVTWMNCLTLMSISSRNDQWLFRSSFLN